MYYGCMNSKHKHKNRALSKNNILHISLAINALFFLAAICTIVYFNSAVGRTDSVNRGLDLMCNGQFVADHPGADTTLLNYSCGIDGAAPYFNKGYEDYKSSLK